MKSIANIIKNKSKREVDDVIRRVKGYGYKSYEYKISVCSGVLSLESLKRANTAEKRECADNCYGFVIERRMSALNRPRCVNCNTYIANFGHTELPKEPKPIKKPRVRK